MGSDSVNQTRRRIENRTSFLVNAVKNQAAVWSDFYLKTGLSKPFIVLIEPTLRCPMHCRFCNLSTDKTYPKETELSLMQWRRILAELRASSELISDVFVSGGEPFLRPDMCDIIEYAHHIGLGTRIITIGAFCDKTVCDRLLASPMKWTKFSLHSVREDVHDALVGGNTYAKTIKAIEYLIAHNYGGKIGILTTVWKGNVTELDDIARMAKQLRVDSVFYRPLFGNTSAVRHFGEPAPIHPDCAVTDLSAARTAVDELKQLRRQGYPIADSDRQLDLLVEQIQGTNRGVAGCHMMYESIYIRPNGDVEICGHMSLGTMGNVSNASLDEVLTSPQAYEMRHAVSRNCRCQGNAFVRKSFGEKIAIVAGILRG